MKDNKIFNFVKRNGKNIIGAVSILTAFILFVWVGSIGFYW